MRRYPTCCHRYSNYADLIDPAAFAGRAGPCRLVACREMRTHPGESRFPSGKPGSPLTVLAVAALAFCVVAIIARARPLSNNFTLVVVVASPYVPLVAALGLALSALCRNTFLSVVAIAVLTVTVAVQLPWYFFGRPLDIGDHATIRVLSSNLRKGLVDAPSFVGLATRSADVVTVSELTPDVVTRFYQAGITRAFPYSLLRPGPGASGIGMWSRFPLTARSPAKRPNAAIVAARLRLPHVKVDPLVASVHVTSPVAPESHPFVNWQNGIGAVKAALGEIAEALGPAAIIVAGDFNSTPDMRQFRDLLTGGYLDAVEQTGAGYGPTFPSDPWLPPLITIDHVLTRHAAADAVRTVSVSGSDHRSLLAIVAVPLDPTRR